MSESNADFLRRSAYNRKRVEKSRIVVGKRKSYEEAQLELRESFSFRRANHKGRTFMLEKLKDEYLTVRLNDFM